LCWDVERLIIWSKGYAGNKKNIEQLEEVANQIDKHTPTGARLALLLLDNLIELLAFKKVQYIFALDSMYQRPGKSPKYSPNKRKKVRDYFKDKVNFLVSETKDINHDEGEVLKVGHKFRNEAYHNGVLRETIIESVTSVYFETVCRLLPRLWGGSYSYSREGEVGTFLNKFGIQGSLISTETMEKICNNLLTGRFCSTDNLSENLSNDLITRIDELVEALEHLQADARPDLTPDDFLKEVQFSQTFPGELKFPDTHEGFLEAHRTREEYLSNFNPEITLAVIERWRQQAANIKSATTPGLIMRKFSDIDRHFLKIEELIYEAAAEFEHYIDSQIH